MQDTIKITVQCLSCGNIIEDAEVYPGFKRGWFTCWCQDDFKGNTMSLHKYTTLGTPKTAHVKVCKWCKCEIEENETVCEACFKISEMQPYPDEL